MGPGILVVGGKGTAGNDYTISLGTAGKSFLIVENPFQHGITGTYNLTGNYSIPELDDPEMFDVKELRKIENIAHEQSMHEDKIIDLQKSEIHHARNSVIKHKKPHFTRRII